MGINSSNLGAESSESCMFSAQYHFKKVVVSCKNKQFLIYSFLIKGFLWGKSKLFVAQENPKNKITGGIWHLFVISIIYTIHVLVLHIIYNSDNIDWPKYCLVSPYTDV